MHYRFGIWHTIASFLFLPANNYAHVPEPVLRVGWTLAYEMLFYAVVTLAIALRLPLLKWCACVVISLSLASLVIPHDLGGLTYLADPIELEFLGGMAVAALYLRTPKLPLWLVACVPMIAMVFALLVAPGNDVLEFTPLRPLFWGIPGVLIVWSFAELEPRIAKRRFAPLQLLGDASFSLYLTHTFVLPVAGILASRLHLAGAAGFALFALTGGVACLVVAIVFHKLVELPMLELLMERRPSWSLHSIDEAAAKSA